MKEWRATVLKHEEDYRTEYKISKGMAADEKKRRAENLRRAYDKYCQVDEDEEEEEDEEESASDSDFDPYTAVDEADDAVITIDDDDDAGNTAPSTPRKKAGKKAPTALSFSPVAGMKQAPTGSDSSMKVLHKTKVLAYYYSVGQVMTIKKALPSCPVNAFVLQGYGPSGEDIGSPGSFFVGDHVNVIAEHEEVKSTCSYYVLGVAVPSSGSRFSGKLIIAQVEKKKPYSAEVLVWPGPCGRVKAARIQGASDKPLEKCSDPKHAEVVISLVNEVCV
jgi:hypothetical protein